MRILFGENKTDLKLAAMCDVGMLTCSEVTPTGVPRS